MAADKSERLLNLLIMLLVQRHFVSKAQIRKILYSDLRSDDAFEKKFERDKEELRGLGVPIEVGQMDPYFDDEPGYRVRAEEFALPQIDLTGDEAAVVGLASRVWEQATLARATTEAVRKLSASGVEVDLAALDIAQSRLTAEEPAFEAFWEAIAERIPLTFEYHRSGTAEPATRHLQPYGVTRYSGRWYAVGFDTDRQEERVFRLSRIQGEARKDGRSGCYEIPPDVDLKAVTRRLAPAPERLQVVALVRRGSAWPLRRDAGASGHVEPGVAGPDEESAWDRLSLDRVSSGLADEILSYGTSVVVEEPAELRQSIIDRLQGVLA